MIYFMSIARLLFFLLRHSKPFMQHMNIDNEN